MKPKSYALILVIAYLPWINAVQVKAAESHDWIDDVDCDFIKPEAYFYSQAKNYSSRRLPHHLMIESLKINGDIHLEIKHGGCVDSTCDTWSLTLPNHTKKDSENLLYWAEFLKINFSKLPYLTEEGSYARKHITEVLHAVSKSNPKGDSYRICQDGSYDQNECSWRTGGIYLFEAHQVETNLKIAIERCDSR